MSRQYLKTWIPALLVLIGVIFGVATVLATVHIFGYAGTPRATTVYTTETVKVTETEIRPETITSYATSVLTVERQKTVTLTKTIYVTKTITLTKTVTVTVGGVIPTGPAPDFTLPEVNEHGLTGEYIRLSKFSGKPIFLEFISPTCSHCLGKTSMVSELQRRYGDKVEFISVVLGSVEATRTLLQNYRERVWTHVVDEHGNVFQSYGIKGVPTYIILNADHVEAGRFLGAGTEPEDLEEIILRVIS